MSKKQKIQKKYTRQLVSRLRVAHRNEPVAVIVHVKDVDGLERPGRHAARDFYSVVESEKEHSQHLMENLVEFVHQLEEEGDQVELLDTSWLTNSMLLVATPPTLSKLAERDDVALLDVNAELGEAHVSY